MSEAVVIQTQPKPRLPREFEVLLDQKLNHNGKGRTHLIKELGSREKVLNLLGDAWIGQMKPSEIAKKYNVGYYQVYRFLKEVEPYRENIIAYIKAKSDEEFISPNNYDANPIIQEWIAKIRRSGHTSALSHVPIMRNVLGYPLTPKQKATGVKRYVKGFRCTPEKFDLEMAKKFVDAYLKQHKVKKLPQKLRLAIRHFLMVAKEISIPRGFGSQLGLSGEKDNYGKYRYVRFSEDQIEKIREFLKDDLEALTFFDWGIESLARASTIAKTKMTEFLEENGVVTTSLYETKTERPFQKFLILSIPHARETWEEIQQLGKGRLYLFFEDTKVTRYKIDQFLNKLSPRLKEAYKYAGVKDEYAYRKPFHVLRHAGAHLWLMRSNYDYGLVAEMGWEDITTLRQVYGGMPTEVLRSKIMEIGRR
ncbi:hypothetical protein DRJ16_00295 [Candidatus Woesearchaeota archaeon]|nr:MAG: hypothetical protein DRJ16_00295 [Candidatus Woesearchaeota archaeon]